MGAQSSAVRQLGIPGVATTYITGTLTNLTEEAIGRLRSAVPRQDSRAFECEGSSARGLLLPVDVWLAYGLGAVLTGGIMLRWPSFAVLPCVIVLAAVVVVATTRRRRRGLRS